MRIPHHIDHIHPIKNEASSSWNIPIKSWVHTIPFLPIHDMIIVPTPGRKMLSKSRQNPTHPFTGTIVSKKHILIYRKCVTCMLNESSFTFSNKSIQQLKNLFYGVIIYLIFSNWLNWSFGKGESDSLKHIKDKLGLLLI